MPRLIILTKGGRIRQVSVSGRLTTIGRNEGNSLIIDSELISRQHAVIDWDGDHYALMDAGSRNGTFVNGLRVDRQKLRNGDMITMGDCEIRFLFDTRELSEADALRLVTIPGTLQALDAAKQPPSSPAAKRFAFA
ncbi:FHA domain-containing protein [Variovorax dokdonensis]|uniref:FHA domain-containing protein n=1 Tax=Variovorax dokdonensis TaxID=344883 RepID=A0ABT7N5Y9_9BURK|nr:FHA domain-containing protein [Variovorax dokdonensis]MDM0043338.1 FHA domain-containing protein [Variovorax dokdonensis]